MLYSRDSPKSITCFVETMEVVLLFSAICLKFTIMMALLSTVKTTPLCPNKCNCTGDVPVDTLTVDCRRNVNVNGEKQLDSVLSSNVTYGSLRSLTIINTPLTNVPRSVCRLTSLTRLSLDFNRLTRLPDNCFTNLKSLTSLTASHNNITELQHGLFDGLHKLQTLQLHHNRISSIGLRVFNGSAVLTSLRELDLSYNRIQILEPWVYYVGLNGHFDNRAKVNLSHNDINAFTNMIGLKARCGMTAIYVDLILDHNPIKHISDILHGWNVSLITLWCLSPYRHGLPGSHISFYHNNMECDCVDFDIYKLAFTPPVRSYLVANAYCSGPRTLYRKRIAAVQLDQFVCVLTERCPPGCRCVHRPANATLHVYCSNANLTVLPLELPKLPKSYTTYKLDFSNNRRLHRLQHRDYFVNTSILDVSNCKIDSVDFEMWNDLANMTHVLLDGNQLQALPSSVAAVSLERSRFSLSRNPWKCSCDASWMSSWLKSVNNSLAAPNAITCSSPSKLRKRNIMSINGETFCEDPASEVVQRTIIKIMSSVTCIFVIVICISITVYRLRVKVYFRWKFHPFDRDECVGEDMDYDVFLSCSSNNNLPHGNRIREHLEERGYRVCYPPRDFLAGETIYDNIYNAVVRSKRTVCFVTAQFLQRFVLCHSAIF